MRVVEGKGRGNGREGKGKGREGEGEETPPLHAPLIHISGYAPGRLLLDLATLTTRQLTDRGRPNERWLDPTTNHHWTGSNNSPIFSARSVSAP